VIGGFSRGEEDHGVGFSGCC